MMMRFSVTMRMRLWFLRFFFWLGMVIMQNTVTMVMLFGFCWQRLLNNVRLCCRHILMDMVVIIFVKRLLFRMAGMLVAMQLHQKKQETNKDK